MDNEYANAYEDGLRMFRANYDNNEESEYFNCGKSHYNKNENDVITEAKEKTGTDYSDVGWVECELVEIWEVDRTTECLNDIICIYR